ncbi:MAG: amidohydrolase [Microbacterium sp.]|uniref:amidohydrolase n=1 Tax=Microbacterium sp. TaxID=51671 RepID=UPI0039E2DFC5
MPVRLYTDAVVFTADRDRPDATAFAVRDGQFLAVGSEDEVRAELERLGVGDAVETALSGRFVLPGIVDSHTHLAMFGEALGKVQLRDCASLPEIQERLREARAADPDAKRLLGVSWLFDAVGDEHPTREMIDAAVSDIPVYLDANDLHSCWVNSAALDELGITADTPDPIGGEIARDADGNATGMLYETASTQYVWGFLNANTTEDEVVAHLETAFAGYLADGVTSATDMALMPGAVAGIRALLARDGRLPFPITGHVLVEPSGDTATDLAVVADTVRLRDELARTGEDEWFRVAGMKFIMDGVIDACTAAMRAPYADGSNCDPIWEYEPACPVAAAADAAGLQIAMHAIGDRSSEIALDLVEHCIRVNGERPRHHRVEHLESVTEETIERMARLGVVASMQPVHCDPAVLANWKAVLADERQERGFPWQWLRKHGVEYTLGSDAPTAPHHPLPNLYIALTGKSALNPSLEPYHPERAFTPEDALVAFTHGGAYAGGFESTRGRIAPGLEASFAVLDTNPLTADPRDVLTASVLATYVRGEAAYTAV